ncbi:inorganic diphosphatase PPA2 KNAG_0J00370 [Huiozyma naganishii CBS 8797]|uniref:inorganic diphosphatase n=1 Tax=Huiozyma naganishii (strain ATCC MYA-139 / BCRC 22969 / CBS 8797 / KCTC 17520 / NBRC 10181 / NCYC 3082 / Yp74L-3) TaxID=1071383 RepID=J7RB64_HUIN7|nr:hypothetical protein KNAG_0J00370 [Kazachstania naganishii CBS 8797]CCK72120.1 hypothetical protein KNAG_0J00370 [Kazachstania naganishii CBS 8797]
MLQRQAFRRLSVLRSHLQREASFSTVSRGAKFSLNYRQYLKMPNGELGSWFHDLPIGISGNTVNMLVEIPRWSNAKFEVSKEQDFNPIMQDSKKGKARFVNNLFPFKGYIHNYGAIPQTWEDPTGGLDGLKGDNDPIDCCEIGSAILPTGTIARVKVLGSIALIDDDELDWKVIVINEKDPLFTKIDSLHDVETYMPKLLEATREWLQNYKIPSGKPENKFALNGQYCDAEHTMGVIRECHDAWSKLVCNNLDTKVNDLPCTRRAGEGVTLDDDFHEPVGIPNEVDKWFFIKNGKLAN